MRMIIFDNQVLDVLWNKYWVSTLAQSVVVIHRDYAVGQLEDLAEKLSRTKPQVGRKGGMNLNSLEFNAAINADKYTANGTNIGSTAEDENASNEYKRDQRNEEFRREYKFS